MNKDKPAYIFGFATAVCLVCSIFVSGSAVMLKDRQVANEIVDRQKQVLSVAGLIKAEETGTLTASDVGDRFESFIVPRAIDLKSGNEAKDVDVASFSQVKASKDPSTSEAAPANAARVRRIPNNALIYEVVEKGEVTKIILPIEGNGLWGLMRGYIALESDGQTVAGITYYKHIETPGLGAEVENPKWKSLWPGRKVYDGDKVAIEVIKGNAGAPGEDPYKVDGLSGATLTSRGVTNMLQFWFGENGFGPYLKRIRKG